MSQHASSLLLPLRVLRAHSHLTVSALFGFGLYAAFRFSLPEASRLLIAWDGAVLLYIGWSLLAMSRIEPSIAAMRERARYYDEGRGAVLLLATATAIASLAAIIHALMAARGSPDMLAHMMLVGITVVCSWLFVHFIFALHYAHVYYDEYRNTLCKGLDFPGDVKAPDYWDFLYFSFIIGTSAQTADVGIDRRHMRHIVLVHCIIAFFFNTTVLALAINAAAGLVG